MIRFEEATRIVMDHSKLMMAEQVNLSVSHNRILAQDVISDMDMPPFNKSAMDGYACKMEDIHETLEVVEIIAAGDIPQKSIGKNQCAKIMTGAKIPDGADCVIMVEHTEKILESTIKFTSDHTNINIAWQGEDIKTGDVVLKKGTFIKPQHIAILASVGCADPLVYKKPKVAVIATGSELVEPNLKPGPTQIRNSNAWQLIAQIERANAIPAYQGIAVDSEIETDLAIKKAISENDVVLLTGGVSMGDYDFVPKILMQNKVNLLFEKIQIKPGMPTVFGVHENAFIFGLPGNPVSTFILFELLVRPFLNKMMGRTNSISEIKLPLGIDYNRRNADRMAWIPSKINTEGELIPVEYHGSAHVNALSDADFIFSIDIGIEKLSKGEKVHARPV
jgi:molybdopterin molybdotransferase